MRLDAIAIGVNPPDDVNVVIEVPIGGEPIKYEMDKAAGTLVVDRFLHTPMYPGNYGFVPHTLSQMAIQSCTSPPLTSWGGKGRLNAVLQKMSLRSNLPGPAAHLLYRYGAEMLTGSRRGTAPVTASSQSTTPPVQLRDLKNPNNPRLRRRSLRRAHRPRRLSDFATSTSPRQRGS